MELIVVIFAIVSVVLSIVLVVEYVEYRRYIKAARALIAFGEGMKVTFNDILTELNRQGVQGGMLQQSLNLTDQEVIFLKSVLQVHSEALGLQSMTAAFRLQDQFQGVARNGEDPSAKV